jgi:hypothetical protein
LPPPPFRRTLNRRGGGQYKSIVRLIGQVITMSLETLKIVKGLPKVF